MLGQGSLQWEEGGAWEGGLDKRQGGWRDGER